MAGEKVNVIIRINPGVNKLHLKERLSALAVLLQNLQIEVIELSHLGHLVIDTEREKWDQAIREIAELTNNDIDIQPNTLI